MRPFGVRVLLEFNSDLANIDTWTYHKVRSNYERKSYLESFGLNLKGSWTLISEQSSSRVKETWRLYGEGPMNMNEIEALHKTYVENYKPAKADYKKRKKTIMGWYPDYKFLQSLNQKQESTENLENIAAAIENLFRQQKGLPKTLDNLRLRSDELFKNKVYVENSDDEINSEEKLINLIQNSVEKLH